MAELAAKETLCLRLNVDDYRTFSGFLLTTTSDMQLLSYMLKGRSTSKFANEDARRESRIWLAEHAGEFNGQFSCVDCLSRDVLSVSLTIGQTDKETRDWNDLQMPDFL